MSIFEEAAAELGCDPDELAGTFDSRTRRALVPDCSCARHGDGSVTTSLCPQHAREDPCATMAAVTGQRRRGSIIRGKCSACGWSGQWVAPCAPYARKDS